MRFRYPTREPGEGRGVPEESGAAPGPGEHEGDRVAQSSGGTAPRCQRERGEKSERLRINRLDAVVAREVSGVERKNLVDAVCLHRGDKPGIVNLDAQDFVCGHELPPGAVRERGVRQDGEVSFEKARVAFGARDTDPQSVMVGRGCANVPEFPHILGRKAKLPMIPMQGLQRGPRNGAKRVVVLNCPEHNVGVDENSHPLRRYHRSGYQFSRLKASSCRTGC